MTLFCFFYQRFHPFYFLILYQMKCLLYLFARYCGKRIMVFHINPPNFIFNQITFFKEKTKNSIIREGYEEELYIAAVALSLLCRLQGEDGCRIRLSADCRPLRNALRRQVLCLRHRRYGGGGGLCLLLFR